VRQQLANLSAILLIGIAGCGGDEPDVPIALSEPPSPASSATPRPSPSSPDQPDHPGTFAQLIAVLRAEGATSCPRAPCPQIVEHLDNGDLAEVVDGVCDDYASSRGHGPGTTPEVASRLEEKLPPPSRLLGNQVHIRTWSTRLALLIRNEYC
jgi:hypothetical protein